MIIGHVAQSDKIMRKSARQFFDTLGFDEVTPQKIEEVATLFNEWLLFEFEVSPGKSVLQWYFDTTFGDGKGDKELKEELGAILKTNTFQPFMVQKFKAGEYVVAKGFTSGQVHKIYDITFSKEVASTPNAIHQTFFGRIGIINGRWEFVGGNIRCMPISMSPRMQKNLYGKKFSFTNFVKLCEGNLQKDIVDEHDDTGFTPQVVDVEKTKQTLDKDFIQVKKKLGFKGHYKDIVDLIFNEKYRTNFADFITDSFKCLGLGVDGANLTTFKKLTTILFTMWNVYPHKNLKGLSPNQMREKGGR